MKWFKHKLKRKATLKKIIFAAMLLPILVIAITSCTEDWYDVCEVTVVSGEGGTAIIYPSESNKIIAGWWVELTATPEKNYHFVNWTVNGKEVSRDNPYKATLYKSTQFKANFKDKYTVKVLSSEGGTAKASQEGEVLNGTKVTFTVTPEEGYSFVNWMVNGEVVSTENPYVTTITEDIEIKANFKPIIGIENGYKWVDLGLSVKWATCNVGAGSPEEYGDYFAWGETSPKTTYDWSTYKYGDFEMTKYSKNPYNGIVDNKTTLELSDDAARVNWGGKWRMPTTAEQDELKDTNNCTWEWTTKNWVEGYKVTSKKNGNSIFLPTAGYRFNDELYAGYYGYYWSSSLSWTYSDYDAQYLRFYSSGGIGWGCTSRYLGQSVRAVCP